MEKMASRAKLHSSELLALVESTHFANKDFKVVPFGKRFMIESKDTYFLPYTSGIGTKGFIHWKAGTERKGVQDVFAMVVNGLVEGGFNPVFLQAMFMQNSARVLEEGNETVNKVVDELSYLCRRNKIIITSGNNVVINTLEGFEIGLTAVGMAAKGYEIRGLVHPGDIIIGIGSSGVHCDGFTSIRNAFSYPEWWDPFNLFHTKELRLDKKLAWGPTVGEELTESSNSYIYAIKGLISHFSRNNLPNKSIHGMVHINESGLSKLRELIDGRPDVDIRITRTHKLEPQEIYKYLRKSLKMTSEDMYRKFNNGIGFVVVVEREKAEETLALLRPHYAAEVIGTVRSGTGRVHIESKYDDKTIVY